MNGNPPVAAGADGWRAILVERWRTAQRHAVVGPGDPAVHLERAESMADVLEVPRLAVDLGSGAGIPGLALAGLWPESVWVLVDAAQRRVRLLEQTVADLGWSARVSVVHGRAENVAREPQLRGRADLVTSRLFGPPGVVAECGAPFLAVGGILAVTEPPESLGDRWPEDALQRLALADAGLRRGVKLLRATALTADHFPRRPGVPAKRPLF